MFAAYSPADNLGRESDKLTAFLKDPAIAERKTIRQRPGEGEEIRGMAPAFGRFYRYLSPSSSGTSSFSLPRFLTMGL